jgi:hypothetical protein
MLTQWVVDCFNKWEYFTLTANVINKKELEDNSSTNSPIYFQVGTQISLCFPVVLMYYILLLYI